MTYSSHYCADCHKHFNIALTDLAPPGGHDTNRVIDLAVRVVVEDSLPSPVKVAKMLIYKHMQKVPTF